MARSGASGLLISLLVLVAGLLLAFTVGRFPIGIGDLFSVLFAKLTGQPSNVAPAVETVIWPMSSSGKKPFGMVANSHAVATKVSNATIRTIGRWRSAASRLRE